MVNIEQFISGVDAISAEDPDYKLGHDGSDGTCDCIGLIIGAIRRAGGTWDGTHGSNYAARNEMAFLLPVTDVSDLNVGEIVYKAAKPGQTNYNLPSRYGGDPDKNDYYHVGVVRSVSPLKIVHCTGPGIVIDTKLGKWNYRGWLNKVSREEGEEPMSEIYTATVVAESGRTVRMRRTPSTDDKVYWDVPIGTVVPVSGHQDGWSRISYNGRAGWMMDKFLFGVTDGSGATSQLPESNGNVLLSLPQEVAQGLKKALDSALGKG